MGMENKNNHRYKYVMSGVTSGLVVVKAGYSFPLFDAAAFLVLAGWILMRLGKGEEAAPQISGLFYGVGTHIGSHLSPERK